MKLHYPKLFPGDIVRFISDNSLYILTENSLSSNKTYMGHKIITITKANVIIENGCLEDFMKHGRWELSADKLEYVEGMNVPLIKVMHGL